MIIYDLRCRSGHPFEGWFKDRAAFEQQKEENLIACPVCGGTDVTMVPSSVAIRARDARADSEKASGEPLKVLRQFQEYIHKHFDDVGDRFAEVALRIHHGEEEKKNIRGTTTPREEETLLDEGVAFIKIPLPKFDG